MQIAIEINAPAYATIAGIIDGLKNHEENKRLAEAGIASSTLADIDALPDPVIWCDPDFAILTLNRAARDLLASAGGAMLHLTATLLRNARGECDGFFIDLQLIDSDEADDDITINVYCNKRNS